MSEKIYIKTGRPEFDNLIPMVKSFLEKDVLEVVIDGKRIRGYRSPDAKSIWIRDYSDMLRGVKYFEPDVKTVVEHFAETQAENGRIFDYFTTFPEKLPCERENWTKYVRVPVEADVEYRFVKAAFLAWQATGDDEWIMELLPKLEKALQYVLSHPWRWNRELRLVKRPYTIDTWDFAYTAGKHKWLQFQIDDNTFWGIMHGDNSGYYEAFWIISKLHNYFDNTDESERWHNRAERIRTSMNNLCWNGNFYSHFVKVTPMKIPGVDEANQLSLSNPMDINRGVADHDMAVSIIREYIKRRETTEAFAEWFSIDPPFLDGIFGDDKLVKGAYVNGGIMPLVGGELAKAAFDHGFEDYGADILKRYFKMIAEKGESYLWYFPDVTPASIDTSTSPEATPTDGWGSSAMLYALIEGLAGIEDRSKLYQRIRLSPRWVAAGIEKAETRIGYEASSEYLEYAFRHDSDHIQLGINSPASEIEFHVMIPEHTKAISVQINNAAVSYQNLTVENSRYVDFTSKVDGKTTVRIILTNE